MKEMIVLVLGFVLVNNYALSAYFGLTPLLGFASKKEKILALGLSVTGVMLLASLVLWLLRGLVPAWATTLTAVAVVLALVYLLQALLGKRLGVFFPVIALNSAVLATALQLTAADSLITLLLSALGAGLGFLFGLFLLSGLEARIEDDQLPKAFRGLPIRILAAAIAALALTAFKFK
ncbi:MAG: Rnf-Nqr domain containing protein [Clostridia bacterium]